VRDTLEGIYRDHRQGLFSVALSVTRSADRAEDAVHDAFARLCRATALPQGDPVAYAYAAVRNAAIDITRRRTELPVDWAEQGSANGNGRAGRASILAAGPVDDELMAAESQELARQAVDELPDIQREVLVMKLYAGLTFDQIGQALGEPLSTVASRYRRALDRLKEVLAGVA
jgi:RNA polymerase sigma-70 factor (ECF subfamily)